MPNVVAERSLNVYTRHACRFYRWFPHKQSPKQPRWKIKWKKERERERKGTKKRGKKEEKWRSSNFIFHGARLSLVPFYKQSSKHPWGKIPPLCSKLNLPTSFSVDLFVNSCHAPPIQIKRQTENSTIRTGRLIPWI